MTKDKNLAIVIELKNLTGHSIVECYNAFRQFNLSKQDALAYLLTKPVKIKSSEISLGKAYLHFNDELYKISSNSMEAVKNEKVYSLIKQLRSSEELPELVSLMRNLTHEEFCCVKIIDPNIKTFIYHHRILARASNLILCEKALTADRTIAKNELIDIIAILFQHERSFSTDETKKILLAEGMAQKTVDTFQSIHSYV